MRTLVAAVLAFGLLVAAGIPHVHAAGHAAGHAPVECTVCAARHGDVPRSETPDVTPRVIQAEPVFARPALAPVTGAPLGAIPGQSPPAAA